MEHGLTSLEERLAQDLLWLNLPAKDWVPPRIVEGERVLDVAVVGAGLCGLVALAGLHRVGIYNVAGFDRSEEGREGPWVTFARMETLRTRKEASGPALGVPSLTFRAWFEAQFGRAAYEQMGLIPRGMWMDYLIWYRRVLKLPVTNGAHLTKLDVQDDGLISLIFQIGEEVKAIRARRVILATGLDGLGAPTMPDVASKIPRRFVAHGAEMIDLSSLAGKRISVVGAGASAMDNAAAALEAGAARVDVFVRRADIPRVDKFSGVGSQGMTHGYLGLPDADKWTLMVEGERAQIPPPRHSMLRVTRHANAHIHLSSPIVDLRQHGASITLTTPKGQYATDFVIFATGFSVDFAKRPEFAALDGKVRLWRDVYVPPQGMEHAGIGETPYLGPSFEFLPKEGAPKDISRIHCFAYPAVPSHGKITSGIPSISDGAARLSQGIARLLFGEDRALHLENFRNYATPELLGDEWHDADEKETSFDVSA